MFELQRTTSAGGAAQISCPNMHTITKRIEFVNNRWKRIRDGRDIIQTSTQSLQGTTSTGQVFTKLNKLSRKPKEGGKLVGFQHDFLEMLDHLTGYPPEHQVLTVVGLGIGKTTFTESLYDDPLVRHHFDIRAWFTISEQYQVKEVLISLLCGITGPMANIYERRDDESIQTFHQRTMANIYERSDDELIETIHERLSEKIYLIVLDDMWDKQAWNDLKRIFPNDENGSRIILTTRLKDVAEFESPDTQPRCMPHWSIDERWELFRSKISINELCPPQLEPISKQIACKYQGLPLAIFVVAILLSKMNMTLEVWNDVAKSACSIVKQEHCLL